MRSHCFSSFWTERALLLTTGQVGEGSNGIISVSLFPIQCFCFTKMLPTFPFSLQSPASLSLSLSFLSVMCKGHAMAQPLLGENILMAARPPEEYHCKNTVDTVYWKVQFLCSLLSLCVKFEKYVCERVALTSEAVVGFWATESNTHFKSNHNQAFTHA